MLMSRMKICGLLRRFPRFYHGNDSFTESHCIKWVTVQQTSPVASTSVWQAGLYRYQRRCCLNALLPHFMLREDQATQKKYPTGSCV